MRATSAKYGGPALDSAFVESVRDSVLLCDLLNYILRHFPRHQMTFSLTEIVGNEAKWTTASRRANVVGFARRSFRCNASCCSTTANTGTGAARERSDEEPNTCKDVRSAGLQKCDGHPEKTRAKES